jgi:hypothetical protein
LLNLIYETVPKISATIEVKKNQNYIKFLSYVDGTYAPYFHGEINNKIINKIAPGQ